MWEVKEAEEVPQIAVGDCQEDQCVWQQFPQQCNMYIISRNPHQLLGGLELQFRTDAISGDEEDEEHDDTRYQQGTEVEVVVHPRIVHGVEVDGDRLQ